jgi:hypothetical protein
MSDLLAWAVPYFVTYKEWVILIAFLIGGCASFLWSKKFGGKFDQRYVVERTRLSIVVVVAVFLFWGLIWLASYIFP